MSIQLHGAYDVWQAHCNCCTEANLSWYESGASMDTPVSEYENYVENGYEWRMREWYGLDLYTPIPDYNVASPEQVAIYELEEPPF